jgi:DNA-directed RNA polymerase specialized sigma24 family protein
MDGGFRARSRVDVEGGDAKALLEDLRVAAKRAGVRGRCARDGIDLDDIISTLVERTLRAWRRGGKQFKDPVTRPTIAIVAVRRAVIDAQRSAPKRHEVSITGLSMVCPDTLERIETAPRDSDAEDVTGPSPEAKLVADEEAAAVESATKTLVQWCALSPLMWSVLKEGLSYAEAADRHGVHKSTATRLRDRFFRRVRADLYGAQLSMFPLVTRVEVQHVADEARGAEGDAGEPGVTPADGGRDDPRGGAAPAGRRPRRRP